MQYRISIWSQLKDDCALETCKNDSRYPHLHKRNKNNDQFNFIIFLVLWPTIGRRAYKWIIACHGDDNFVCTKDSYICNLHFIGDIGSTKANPDPVSSVASNETVICITVNDFKNIWSGTHMHSVKKNSVLFTG